MKMVIVILQDKDSEPVSQALISTSFRVTRIASSGGFLRRGSTTLMIGVDDEKASEAVEVIRKNCSSPDDSGAARTTLFVLQVASFEQL